MLIQQHWSLALASRRQEVVALLAGELGGLAITEDVSTPEGAQSALTACLAEFGRPPAALAQCAGNTLITPLHRTAEGQFRDCLTANFYTAYYSLQAYIGQCLEHDQPGSAVLVGSVAARIGVANHEAIAACKGAVGEGLDELSDVCSRPVTHCMSGFLSLHSGFDLLAGVGELLRDREG